MNVAEKIRQFWTLQLTVGQVQCCSDNSLLLTVKASLLLMKWQLRYWSCSYERNWVWLTGKITSCLAMSKFNTCTFVAIQYRCPYFSLDTMFKVILTICHVLQFIIQNTLELYNLKYLRIRVNCSLEVEITRNGHFWLSSIFATRNTTFLYHWLKY